MFDLMSDAKEYPIIFSAPMVRAIREGRKTQSRRLITNMWANAKMHVDRGEPVRLWVQEAWALCDDMHGNDTVYYRADGDDIPGPWRSPRHMPRWASRITLDVVSMRKERLQVYRIEFRSG